MAKRIFLTILIAVLLICLGTSSVHAMSVKVTEENLKETMDELVEEKGGGARISVENNKITIQKDSWGDIIVIIKYDLQGNPKFFIETEIKKDGDIISDLIMQDFVAELYGVVAEIQGVDGSEADTYISQYKDPFNYFMESLEETPEDYFEAVKDIFSTAYTFDDSDKYDTFSWVTKEQDVTDTSFKLVSTLTIKSDADFSKINISSSEEKKVVEPISTKPTNTTNENKTEVTQQNTQVKNTVTETILPKTGEIKDVLLITLYIIIAVSVVCLVVIVVKSKKQ